VIFERLKTVLLTLLVLLSILLTYQLWTYQPNYDFIAEQPQYFKDISIGKKVDITDVFQPTKLIYHLESDHYGTEKRSKIAAIFQEMQNWNLESFYTIPERIVNIEDLTSIENSVEVVFPAPLSSDIIRFLFKLSEEQFSLEGVERIIISANEKAGKDGTLAYFISFTEQKVVEAKVTNVSFSTIAEKYLADAHVQTPYFKYLLNPNKKENKVIYLADEQQTLQAITYTASKLNAENQLKDVLFNDPDFVRKTQTGTDETTYTDGKRALEFSNKLSMMKYINPVQQHQSTNGFEEKVIMHSYNFINAHSGWTDRFLFNDWQVEKEAVTFRQYINNYPVFATRLAHKQKDIATIYVSWREGQVHEYIRSIINIDRELITNGEVNLARGSQIVDHLHYLEQMKEFNPLLLKDITIGYQMYQINTNLIFLKPSWFILYNGEWQVLQYEPQLEEEEGEEADGLE
jgi:regulatory protein YycH of two-component signal transduction system YycFG